MKEDLLRQAYHTLSNWPASLWLVILTIPIALFAALVLFYLEADGLAEYQQRANQFLDLKRRELDHDDSAAQPDQEPESAPDKSGAKWDTGAMARLLTKSPTVDPHAIVDGRIAELKEAWEQNKSLAWIQDEQKKAKSRISWNQYVRADSVRKSQRLPLKTLVTVLVPPFLDAVGRGTAAGLLISLPLDPTFHDGTSSSLLIGIGGLIGGLINGMHVTAQVLALGPSGSRIRRHPRLTYCSCLGAFALYGFLARIKIVFIGGAVVLVLIAVALTVRDWWRSKSSSTATAPGSSEIVDESPSSSVEHPIRRSTAG